MHVTPRPTQQRFLLATFTSSDFFLFSPPFIRISAIYPDPLLAVVKKETVVSVDSYRHVCPLKRKTGRTSVTITVYDLLIS